MKNNYRLKFSKLNRMIFIGHLDLLKLFQKTFRKANIPVAYSKGFNPHQIMSFANPLPLGFKSIAEYLDVELTEEIDFEYFKKIMNENLPRGLCILDIKKSTLNASSVLEAAEYEVEFKTEINADVLGIMNKKEIFVDKKTKSGVKSVDIRPDIFEITADENRKIKILISTGSHRNLKPETLVEYICSLLEIEYNKFDYKYLRREMYTKINNEFVNLNT